MRREMHWYHQRLGVALECAQQDPDRLTLLQVVVPAMDGAPLLLDTLARPLGTPAL
jgi:hypothetical protein